MSLSMFRVVNYSQISPIWTLLFLFLCFFCLCFFSSVWSSLISLSSNFQHCFYEPQWRRWPSGAQYWTWHSWQFYFVILCRGEIWSSWQTIPILIWASVAKFAFIIVRWKCSVLAKLIFNGISFCLVFNMPRLDKVPDFVSVPNSGPLEKRCSEAPRPLSDPSSQTSNQKSLGPSSSAAQPSSAQRILPTTTRNEVPVTRRRRVAGPRNRIRPWSGEVIRAFFTSRGVRHEILPSTEEMPDGTKRKVFKYYYVKSNLK